MRSFKDSSYTVLQRKWIQNKKVGSLEFCILKHFLTNLSIISNCKLAKTVQTLVTCDIHVQHLSKHTSHHSLSC